MSKKPRPDKPYPGFPLYAHASGQWAKKIKGKFWYFGTWDDPDSALDLYNHQIRDIRAGRRPTIPGQDSSDLITVAEVFNTYLASLEKRMERDEVTQRHFSEVRESLKSCAGFLGKTTVVSQLRPINFIRLKEDFPESWGSIYVGNHIQRIRTAFKWACEADLIQHLPKFGPEFKKPPKRVIRINKQKREAERGGKLKYSADEIQSLIDSTSGWLRACIFLGINCSFGASDCGSAYISEFKGEWYDLPRKKSGILRRAWLWPETREAIDRALETRREPREGVDTRLCFLTSHGMPVWWERQSEATGRTVKSDNVGTALAKVEKKLGMKLPDRNFYSLRRTFETQATATRDQPAIDMVMGHVDGSMAGVYRQGITDDSIREVCEHVRDWLYSGKVP